MEHSGAFSFMVPMNEIQNNLYLGGILAARNHQLLQSHRINSIVCALSGFEMYEYFPEINYHRIYIDDTPASNIKQYLKDAVEFIDIELKIGRNVLVHCAAGISRSSSIVVAYLMAKYSLTYEEALARVKKGRPCACPNIGFERQLRSLDIKELQSCLK